MTLIRSLVEMAAAQTCGNCHEPMGGNHFYRKIAGQNKRFCKKDAIQKAISAGYQPKGNISFPMGGVDPNTGSGVQQATSQQAPAKTPPRQAPGAKTTRQTPPQAPAPTAQQQAAAQLPPSASQNITRPQLENWLQDLDVNPDQYEVINGKLNIHTSVHIADQEYTQLPLPFGKIDGDFEIVMNTLKTFKNFPSDVKGDLIVMHTEIENCDELEVAVGGSIYLASNKRLKNFRKVHKHIRSVGDTITVDLDKDTNGGLGFLLIPGIKNLSVMGNSKVDDIMDEQVTRGADILDVQEELIDAGYKNLARI